MSLQKGLANTGSQLAKKTTGDYHGLQGIIQRHGGKLAAGAPALQLPTSAARSPQRPSRPMAGHARHMAGAHGRKG